MGIHQYVGFRLVAGYQGTACERLLLDYSSR